MAGIFAKERAVFALSSAQAALGSGSAQLAVTPLNVAAGGNASDDFEALFELTVQWATITGIVLETKVADLYLLPSLDGGTTYPDVDLTAGTSVIPRPSYVCSFVAVKAPVANTDMVFTTNLAILHPVMYKAYLLNTSGQIISAGWTLRTVPAQAQSV
jgi:hypothetical protein